MDGVDKKLEQLRELLAELRHTQGKSGEIDPDVERGDLQYALLDAQRRLDESEKRGNELELEVGDLRQEKTELAAELKALRAKFARLETQSVENEENAHAFGELVKKLRDEKEKLEELYEATLPTKGVREGAVVASDDAVEVMVRLENEIELKNRAITSLQLEIKTYEKMMRGKDLHLQKISKELEEKNSSVSDSVELMNQIKKMKLDIMEMNEEKKTLLEIQRLKNKTIESLSRQLEEKIHVEERMKELEKQIESKERELESMSLTREVLEKEQEARDVEMEKMKGALETTTPLQSLEGDKRYLQAEIKKHIKQRHQQEKALRAQQVRIDQLTRRLDSLAIALDDAKKSRRPYSSVELPMAQKPRVLVEDPETHEQLEEAMRTEKVDIVLFDLLEKDNVELRQMMIEKNMLLQEKDEVIEMHRRNTDVLKVARATDLKKLKKSQAESMSLLQKVEAEKDSTIHDLRERELELKKEIQKLRAKLQKHREGGSSVPQTPQ